MDFRINSTNPEIQLFRFRDNKCRLYQTIIPFYFQGGGVGSNDFKAAMDKVDQEYFEEIMKTGEGSENGKSGTTVSVKDDGTTLDDIEVKSG